LPQDYKIIRKPLQRQDIPSRQMEKQYSALTKNCLECFMHLSNAIRAFWVKSKALTTAAAKGCAGVKHVLGS
jgi:hypothetical protein